MSKNANKDHVFHVIITIRVAFYVIDSVKLSNREIVVETVQLLKDFSHFTVKTVECKNKKTEKQMCDMFKVSVQN